MSLVYLKLSSLPEGVAQMLVDLVDLLQISINFQRIGNICLLEGGRANVG